MFQRAFATCMSIALEPHYFADTSPNTHRDGGTIAAIAGVSLAPVRIWGGR